MWAPCVFRAQESADWPSKRIFLPCVSSVGWGRSEKRRQSDVVKESRRGKIPLNAAVLSCLPASLCVCFPHALCVCGVVFAVRMCTLDCNQMRVGFDGMRTPCLGSLRTTHVFVCASVVYFKENCLSLAKQEERGIRKKKSAVTSAAPTPRPPPPPPFPPPPGAMLGINISQSGPGVSVPASVN